jgi:hypothetical protein
MIHFQLSKQLGFVLRGVSSFRKMQVMMLEAGPKIDQLDQPFFIGNRPSILLIQHEQIKCQPKLTDAIKKIPKMDAKTRAKESTFHVHLRS